MSYGSAQKALNRWRQAGMVVLTLSAVPSTATATTIHYTYDARAALDASTRPALDNEFSANDGDANKTGMNTFPTIAPSQPASMHSGEMILMSQAIYSINGSYGIDFQSDGNLVLYSYQNSSQSFVWSTNSSQTNASYFIMQADGNLCLYGVTNTPGAGLIWSSNTAGNSGAYMMVGNDGVMRVYSSSGAVLWSS